MKFEIDTDNMRESGENILATVQDEKLILVIDLTQDIGPSSTGKMIGVASTGGFTTLSANLKGNIYIGKKP